MKVKELNDVTFLREMETACLKKYLGPQGRGEII